MDRDRHEALTAREAQGWGLFEAAVDRVPRERRSDASLPDDWSVKDLLWHVAFWWNEAAATFERIDEGGEPVDDAQDTDAVNAGVLEASRAMSLEDVESGMARIRERMLSAWASLATSNDAEAAETFEGETFLHYEDHRAALDALTAS